MKLLSMSTGGMDMKKSRMSKPLMKQQDSSIKTAMKAVMKMGRANRPKMPAIMKRAEGM